mmetsp:Transcript_42958/g.102185  ORF Transcript_42958/g.102185 Transcript_42958/m.102185 type:complete len:263 (-) Transcript_42958:2911-3699(-)
MQHPLLLAEEREGALHVIELQQPQELLLVVVGSPAVPSDEVLDNILLSVVLPGLVLITRLPSLEVLSLLRSVLRRADQPTHRVRRDHRPSREIDLVLEVQGLDHLATQREDRGQPSLPRFEDPQKRVVRHVACFRKKHQLVEVRPHAMHLDRDRLRMLRRVLEGAISVDEDRKEDVDQEEEPQTRERPDVYLERVCWRCGLHLHPVYALVHRQHHVQQELERAVEGRHQVELVPEQQRPCACVPEKDDDEENEEVEDVVERC